MLTTSRLSCDDDGWELQINDELPYPHFLHILNPKSLVSIDIIGDVSISFAGIVPFGEQHLNVKNKAFFQLSLQT